MDKVKTGNLIKEARIRKNYTQSELGCLVGVSNKAVSRWENGDSFPDVGVLETLASVLDVSIMEIVTGNPAAEQNTADNSAAGEASALKDIIRETRLQLKQKRFRWTGSLQLLAVIACCILSGLSLISCNSLISATDSAVPYVILMLLAMTVSTAGYVTCNRTGQSEKSGRTKYDKISTIISIVTLVWSICLTLGMVLAYSRGYVLFGLKPLSMGPFIGYQLEAVYIINLALLIIELFRLIKKGEEIRLECLIAVAAIFTAVMYSEEFGKISSLRSAVITLAYRTVMVLAGLVIAIVTAKVLKKHYKDK